MNKIKKNNDVLGDNYFNLGRNYYRIGEINRALSYLKQSELTFSQLPKGQYVIDRLVGVFQELATIHLEQNNLDSALIFLQKSDDLFKIKKNIRSEFTNKKLLGEFYKRIGDKAKAKLFFNEAIKMVLEQNGSFRIIASTARQYTNLASLEYDLQNYSEALYNYQKALTHLFYNMGEEAEFPNPIDLQVVRTLDGIQALDGKAKSLYQLYLQNQDLSQLELALSTYQLAAELIKKARQDIMTSGSKQQLAGEVLPVYERAIQVALKMHEVTGEQKYLDQALTFAESNKAILLLESINEQVAKNYGGIPDSLQEKERDVRINIAFYQKNINGEKQKGEKGDAAKISEWEKELFELQQAYSDLVGLLEKEYPKYYSFKYDTRLAELNTIQDQLLDRKSALVEYFVGEQNIFLFLITKENAQVITIAKNETFEEDVQQLLDAVNTPATEPSSIQSFTQLSYQTYQKYLAPALANLPDRITRLIIIPDDRLTYMPFEVLLQEQLEEGTDNVNQKKLPYLLKKYQISYSYSSTLLVNSFGKTKQNAGKPLLAMAPSFNSPLASVNRNCTPEDLYSLQCSPLEVETIAKKLGGVSIIGRAADREFFIQQAGQYRILHLATHSCTDQENPMLSKIYFSDEDLSNYDLYNLELSADLAVLSSCNSGSGKLIEGEGVMSLSKGFIHAGCPSTLISLWSVDDCATSDIMIRFYDQLEKGLAKDEALRKAKLSYLESVDKLHQHPYYWAAFVQMGNFVPLHHRGWPKTYYLVGMLILLAGGIFWKKNRRSKQAA